jgi:hypothetical protein
VALAGGVALVGLSGCLDPGFQVVDAGTRADLHAVAAVGASVLAVGERGAVVGFDPDGGRVDASTVAEARGRPLDLLDLAPAPERGLVIAGEAGLVLERPSGEDALVGAPAPTGATLRVVLRPSADEVWVAGDDGVLLARRDGAWAPLEPDGVDLEEGERFSGGWAGGGEAILVTDRGRVVERTEGGWTSAVVATATVAARAGAASRPVPLFGAWSSGPGRARVVVGGQGAMLWREAGAESWRPVPTGVTEDLYGIAGDGEVSIAVGARGAVLEGDPASGFERVDPGLGRDLYDVSFVGDRVVAVGADGAWIER